MLATKRINMSATGVVMQNAIKRRATEHWRPSKTNAEVRKTSKTKCDKIMKKKTAAVKQTDKTNKPSIKVYIAVDDLLLHSCRHDTNDKVDSG